MATRTVYFAKSLECSCEHCKGIRAADAEREDSFGTFLYKSIIMHWLRKQRLRGGDPELPES